MKSTLENSSPEIRAFIYQQLSDLEALLPQGTAVSVVVEDPALSPTYKARPKKLSEKKVVMQLETAAGNLLVESENQDVYAAITKARDDLKVQLATLQSFLAEENIDRSNQIENILTHKYLH
jgi:ribosome-associated translation inhibitor RaiA